MKTKVFGQKIKYTYSVDNKRKEITDSNGELKVVYDGRPELKKESNVEWSEICEFEGEPRYNLDSEVFSFYDQYHKINISESEKVYITEEIFRADLNELHLHTDKILAETDLNKKDAEVILENELKSFNKEMIEADEKMKSYCTLHKLNPEETDCIGLFKLLYSTDLYLIKNGKLTAYYPLENGSSQEHCLVMV